MEGWKSIRDSEIQRQTGRGLQSTRKVPKTLVHRNATKYNQSFGGSRCCPGTPAISVGLRALYQGLGADWLHNEQSI